MHPVEYLTHPCGISRPPPILPTRLGGVVRKHEEREFDMRRQRAQRAFELLDTRPPTRPTHRARAIEDEREPLADSRLPEKLQLHREGGAGAQSFCDAEGLHGRVR